MRVVALVAVFLLAAGCRKVPSESNRPPSDNEAADSDRNGEAERAEGAEAKTGEGGGLPGPTLPNGPMCDGDADCGAGMVCEGVGCGPGQGRCVAEDRMCTRDLAQYCGCDGQTFGGSGTCPGARYAYRGPCDAKREDGEPCTDGRQCLSGSCVGEGLEGCRPADQGVCGSAACTKDLVTYCSCNNTEFQASSTCPNNQFAYRGPCEG